MSGKKWRIDCLILFAFFVFFCRCFVMSYTWLYYFHHEFHLAYTAKRWSNTFPLEGDLSRLAFRQVAQTSEANSENSLFRCGSVAPKMKTGRLRTLGLVIDINKTPFLRFQKAGRKGTKFVIPSVDGEASEHGGFLKWWVSPTTMGFPTKSYHFGVFWGVPPFKETPISSWRNDLSPIDVVVALRQRWSSSWVPQVMGIEAFWGEGGMRNWLKLQVVPNSFGM